MPALTALISLIFGLIALGALVVAFIRHKQQYDKNWFLFSIASVSACSISLFSHIVLANYEITRNDWSALGDWSEALRLPSILLIVTLALNAVLVYINRKGEIIDETVIQVDDITAIVTRRADGRTIDYRFVGKNVENIPGFRTTRFGYSSAEKIPGFGSKRSGCFPADFNFESYFREQIQEYLKSYRDFC
jgi:cytochrome c oxidase subunit 4